MDKMPGEIKMEPAGSRPTGLPACEIRDRYNQTPTWFENSPNLCQHLAGIGEMLQYMPEDDLIKRAGGESGV
jgi:hypothetical protein